MSVRHAVQDTSPRKGEVGAQRRVGVDKRFDRTPLMTAKARRLRLAMTDAERKLWSGLRKDQLGVAFRRQHPIGKYVLDFYCASLGLVIELDGGQHGARFRGCLGFAKIPALRML